jgi:hypothetical protein
MDDTSSQRLGNMGGGYTDTERLLGQLARRSFLSPWSYSNLYRDQRSSHASKDGKELCDLLVVFGDHLVIFSDKYCEVPRSGDEDVKWSRWFKRAVLSAAKQVWGAERWIKEGLGPLYLDRRCLEQLPIDLPDRMHAKIHRVVVANGLQRAYPIDQRRHNGLKIVPSIEGHDHLKKEREGGEPYAVGNLSASKGFVHVFDDTNLIHVLDTLDTVSDFIAYLEAKERLFASGRFAGADSELDLLAAYLMTFDQDDNHTFPPSSQAAPLWVPAGTWEAFVNGDLRAQQIEADRISYFWDALIEQTSENIGNRTEYYTTLAGLREGEKILRVLAQESRFRRRTLARNLVQVAQYNDPNQNRFARTMQADLPGRPYFIFMTLEQPRSVEYDRYRVVGREMMQAYCMAAKLKFPDAQTIIGIATEYGAGPFASYDLMRYEAREFTAADRAEAERLRDLFRLYTSDRAFESSEYEYPFQGVRPQIIPRMKGSMRNQPCPCGSGKKFKHCCARLQPNRN